MKKRYSIVYCDPPWSYNDKCHAGERGAEYKYKCMSVLNIATMEVNGRLVSELAADNAALFLWVTPPMLPHAIPVMEAWGFKYKTVAFQWIKTHASGKYCMGMGNYTRANGELCLLGLRGKMKRVSASVRALIVSPRLSHSEKPAEVRDRIVELFGDLPRIELFARQRAKNWTAWGDELPRKE